MNVWAAVFLGGGIGSLMRYGTTRLLLAWGPPTAFPLATLASNVVSVVILAWFTLRMSAHFHDRPALAAFITVGICGGFSTFSTFSYENFLLLREGNIPMAVANILVNVIACLLIFLAVARQA